MKNLIKYFFLLLLSAFSCKEDCEDPVSVSNEPVHLIVIDDSSRINLIRDNNLNPNYYDIDSIKFYNEDFQILPEYNFSEGMESYNTYSIFLYFLKSRNMDFDPYRPDTKTFYLYLNKNDLDTIRVEYDFDPKDCGYTIIKEDVYINGQFQNPEDPEFGRIYVIEK